MVEFMTAHPACIWALTVTLTVIAGGFLISAIRIAFSDRGDSE